MKSLFYIFIFSSILWSCQNGSPSPNIQLQTQHADSIRESGISEHIVGNYHLALQYYFDALSIYREIQDSSKQARTLISIGILNSGLDDHDKSLAYYQEALLLNNNKNELRTAQITNNIGLAHLHNNNYNLALKSFNKSIFIKKKKGLDPTEFNYANIGRVYLELEDKDSALYYLTLGKEALENYKSESAKRDSMEILNYFGQVLIAKSDYSAAEEYFKNSYFIAESASNKNFIESNSTYLSVIYKAQNNLDSALKYSEIRNNYSDSLFREKNLKTIAKIETQHALEQIEKENIEELQKKNTTIYIILLAATLLLLLVIVVINSYLRSKRIAKLLHLKNEEINNQKIEKLRHENEIETIKSNIDGQEKERKRIAEELHDGIGGSLSGIKLALLNLNDSDKAENKINKLALNIDEVCTEIRTISHNLIPPNFEKTAFIDLLENYFHQFKSNTNINLIYHLYPEKDLNSLPLIFHIELYRIIQEATNNVKKHAQATSLEIQLLMYIDEINLIIEDNGIGFDSINISQGIGLKNISSRVNLLNGAMDIDSKLNRGTIINIDFNKIMQKDGK